MRSAKAMCNSFSKCRIVRLSLIIFFCFATLTGCSFLKKPKMIRLIVGGDHIPHMPLCRAAKTDDGYDFTKFYKNIKPHLESADLRFCNLEAPMVGDHIEISGFPKFNAPKQFAEGAADVGFNIFNLANNHMNDHQQYGINETLNLFEKIGPLAFAGVNRNIEEQQKVCYFNYMGVRFAFVSYTDFSNTSNFDSFALNMLDKDLVSKQLTEARRNADIVLVGVHWGKEYAERINESQKKWSYEFAKLGADVVIGTGPHVLQKVEYLPKSGKGETLVWYSLGNMLSAQVGESNLIGGFGVMDINPKSKKIKLVGFLPTYMHYEWSPEQKANNDLNARHSFQIYPLDQAAGVISKSQNNIVIEEEIMNTQKVLGQCTFVKILSSKDFLNNEKISRNS